MSRLALILRPLFGGPPAAGTPRPVGNWGKRFLPLIGIGALVALWAITSATLSPNLPSPLKTWQTSKPYVLDPFEKRGELDQGILRFTGYSLWLVAKGYALALL